jgi:XPG N-terminal domain
MARIRLLLHHGVVPIVVFDGDKLPAKGYTEDLRQRCAQRCNTRLASHSWLHI